MGDLGSEILKKYGSAAVVFALIFAFFVWFLAHWAAAPGREVSVLWGFVKYTKSSPTSTVANSSFSSRTREGKVEDNSQISSDTLPQLNLFVKHGVAKQDRSAILKSLRSDRNLRELTAVESGKRIRDLPAGTYFFLSSVWLSENSPKETLLISVSGAHADRYPATKNYFEMHNTKNGDLHLIGYLNEFYAAEISKLSGTTIREVMVSPYPWGQSTSLVSIPVKRVQHSEPRNIQASEEEKLEALDIKIK